MTTLALQTFTIRRDMKTAAAIDRSFRRLALLGLRAVELAYIRWQPAIVEAVSAASQYHGIQVGSSQITFALLDKRREQMLEFHQQLGCDTTAVSVLPLAAVLGGRDRLLRFAEQLDALGAWYRERGLTLCFHHHDFEFRRYGEQTGFELLMAHTDPDNVALEMDTYWAQRGGQSPAQLVRRMAGRVRVLHLRDYGLRRGLLGMRSADAALGQGNLDIADIVEACREQGVDFMAIEQATPTPWADVAASLAHLRRLGYDELVGTINTTETDA